jgi:small GTP-binding protein
MPATQTRDDIRNLAIVAHVDHGKTTLVDAMLWQSGAFTSHQADTGEVEDRVMDSMDLEREKGITILAKNTSVRYGVGDAAVTFNIIDTPGHADFGGEVERGLSMVDGVLLLVDASEGPLPQTRFVLRKALEAKLPVVLVINKVDRPDARIAEVVDEAYELFLDLDADEHQIEFPIVYCQAKAGKASLTRPEDGTSPDADDLTALFQTILTSVPAPRYDPEAPLQALVTNLDASPYLGRLALCRIVNGDLARGQSVMWCKTDGTMERVKISELLMTEALDRLPAEKAGPGDIVAIAGIPEITIGETLADPDDRRTVDLDDAGREHLAAGRPVWQEAHRPAGQGAAGHRAGGQRVDPGPGDRASRHLGGAGPRRASAGDPGRDHAPRGLRVDRRQAAGRDPRHRRQGARTDGAHDHRRPVGVPGRADAAAGVAQGPARDHDRPRHRLDPDGVRRPRRTETRGTGLLHHIHEGYSPWQGELRTRPTGSLMADRTGPTTGYALANLQERGTMFVGPGTDVYEGMIVGENSRADDMDVNPTKEKKLTNMRQSSGDVLVPLIPHKALSLEQALEFCREDECVEVTPGMVRIRKVVLDAGERARSRGRASKSS